MADIDELTYEGLQTKDNNTLVSDLITGFQDIYAQNGEVLNLDSNTPDGQLIQLFAYAGTTIRELITEVYNSCDPDKCVGAVQDNRYQINYLERKSSSFTLQNITITTNQTVTLEGLDASFNDENASSFTVSDDNGNVWFLVDTTTLLAGSTTLEFRAKNKGAVIPTIGTITNLVTIIPGVISAINNVGATSIGVEEESDSDFRIRRARSVTMASGNNVDNIEARLLALDGVVDVNIHENRTNETDSTNTPAHTIWAIVEGGANTDIADVIYENIGGSDTRGAIEVPLTTASLQEITIRFDRETIIPLYVRFDILPITDMGEIDLDAVKDYIAENLIFNIGESVETSKVTQVCADALLSDGGNGYAINVEVSNGGTATPSTTSTTITSVSAVSSIFQDKVGDVTAIYEFEYSSDSWVFQGSDVDLDDYGISFVGTASAGDKIYIAFTAGTWSDYLPALSIADKYTTDTNKIYISAAN